jgi:hypothetical protein
MVVQEKSVSGDGVARAEITPVPMIMMATAK